MEPKNNIFWTLKDLKIPFVQEHRFDEQRRFRFDFAILEHKIAIEYEGIKITRKQAAAGKKSRHTSLSGYTNDVTKYNMATIAGWKVLRYTALNYTELRNDLLKLIPKS